MISPLLPVSSILSNGEGHKGFIEDLNDFVSQHINKTISDSPSKSIAKLTSDVTELFTNGVMTLNHKLGSETLSDDRLLVRLIEVWHFFFTGVLPQLEAIFLPMMTDEKLVSVLESKNNKLLQERLQQQHLLQQVSATAGLPPSSTALLFRSQPTPVDQPPPNPTGIEIRRLALVAFRDALIQPLFTRLYGLFAGLYDPSLPSPILSSDAQSEPLHLKRLQMVGLLCAAGTGPGASESDALARLLRSRRADPELICPPHESVTQAEAVEDSPVPALVSTSTSPSVRGWTKNREFTRRSIRRQIGRNAGSTSPEVRTPTPPQPVSFVVGVGEEDLEHLVETVELPRKTSNRKHLLRANDNDSDTGEKVGSLRQAAVTLKIRSMNYFGGWVGDQDELPSPL